MTRDHRRQDELTADTIHVPCRGCGSEADAPCTRNGKTARVPCRQRISDACPLADRHTPNPDGYLAWHEWAERMARTHKQARCEGCDRWAVWVPKTSEQETS